jgi:hypothetical protein
MARCTASILRLDKKMMAELGLHGQPSAAFCLPSLLTISYPKCPINEIFRGTIGCQFLGGLEGQVMVANEVAALFPDAFEDNGGGEAEAQRPSMSRALVEEINMHSAFAGLGVSLMRSARQVLDPLASDHEVIKAAENKMLVCLVPEEQENG